MRELENDIVNLGENKIISPLMMEIHLTNLCNHNCIWCISEDNSFVKTCLDIKVVKKLIDSAIDKGCNSFLFSGGGEPLLHPNAIEIFRYCYNKGGDIHLITNGGLLYKYDLHEISEYINRIRISFDSWDYNSHRLIHRPKCKTSDNFINIVNQISKLVHIGKSKIVLSFILDAYSIEYIVNFIDIAEKLNVDGVDIKIKHQLDYSSKKSLLAEAEKKVFEMKCETLDISFDELRKRDDFTKAKWYGLHYKCVISAEGDVFPCCHKMNSEFLFGNINEKNFCEIWGGEKHLEISRYVMGANIACQPCNDSNDAKIINNILGHNQ